MNVQQHRTLVHLARLGHTVKQITETLQGLKIRGVREHDDLVRQCPIAQYLQLLGGDYSVGANTAFLWEDGVPVAIISLPICIREFIAAYGDPDHVLRD